MKKFLLIILIIFISLIIFIGLTVYYSQSRKDNQKISMPTLENKKLAIVIAFKDFKDEEYFVPKEILEKAGVQVVTVSSSRGTARGVAGGEVNIDMTIKELTLDDYDGVIFVGGPGAHYHIDDVDFHRVAKEAVDADKILAAICIAPAILAKSGVLEGKQATVWSSSFDRSAVKILEERGAIYQKKDVVVDGKIITANGPGAAKEFGEKIVELLDKMN